VTKPETKCPSCGRRKGTREYDGLIWCDWCKRLFDPKDDGPYSNDPVRSAMHKEKNVQKRK
jgi:ribosomal protein L37AE/L43A